MSLLDGRLALFHRKQRWLAVADLHFGYELSQRAAGRLHPMWGMTSVEDRLQQLLADYRPRHLVIVGDVVHDRTAATEARGLIERLAVSCEPIVLAGNHDRQLRATWPLQDSWQTKGFLFHHGHGVEKTTDAVQIIGHHHPTGTVARWRRLASQTPGFRSTGEVLDSARVLAVGGGCAVGTRRAEPDLALHAEASLAASASESRIALSPSRARHLRGAMRATRRLDRNGHGAERTILRDRRSR